MSFGMRRALRRGTGDFLRNWERRREGVEGEMGGRRLTFEMFHGWVAVVRIVCMVESIKNGM